jgi:hypothetical protein
MLEKKIEFQGWVDNCVRDAQSNLRLSPLQITEVLLVKALALLRQEKTRKDVT